MFAQSLKSFLQFIASNVSEQHSKYHRFLSSAALSLSNTYDPLAAMVSQLRDGALRIHIPSLLHLMDAIKQSNYFDVDGMLDDDDVVEICLHIAVLGHQHGDALKGAWAEVFQPLFRLALVTSIAGAVLVLAHEHGYCGEDVDELADAVEVALGVLKDVAVAVLSRGDGGEPRQALYERYLEAREQAEQELLRRFSGLDGVPCSSPSEVNPGSYAAQTLCRYGVVSKLVAVAADAASRGATVWLLGRDCDALFIFLRRAGYRNVRYLHGFNREFVRQCSVLADDIARRLVKPGDVVVDTGFAGTCLEPFRRAGVTTVLISSRQDARAKHLCLDVALSQSEHTAVRTAVVLLEHVGEFGSGDTLRANYVEFVRGVPVERWRDDDTSAHIEFVASFVRELEALVSSAHSAAA